MTTSITIAVVGHEELVPADTFVKALKESLATLNAIHVEGPESFRRVRWVVEGLAMHSPPRATFGTPRGRSAQATGVAVFALFMHGMRALVQNEMPPNGFGIEAVRSAHGLFKLMGKDVETFEFAAEGQDSVRVQLGALRNAERTLKELEACQGSYHDLATLEGRLEAVDAHGIPKFYIWEVITGRKVTCLIGEEHIDQALGLFRKRVEVSGRCTYSALGQPASIEVASIDSIPEAHSLPQPRDLGQIDLTGGLDAGTYIRETRDEE